MLLQGVRVLDLGRYIAGPYCAALLADLGADVIRVEHPRGGDDRRVGPVAPGGEGALYLQVNRNKRSLTLDLGRDGARAVLRRLIAASDVVVANLPPATLDAWGLDLASVRRLNPRTVLTVVTAYGRGGPYSERPGFDTIGQALSGVMHLSGTADAPARTLANYNDFGTATACAFGTLAALWERERTGVGQQVEGSLLRTSLIHANALLIDHALSGQDRAPQGGRSSSAAPVDSFRTRSGWIVVQVVGRRSFERWCTLVGQPALAHDPGLATDEQRAQHAGPLCDAMQAWCAARERDDALRQLEAAGIPCAPVLTPRETLADPHVQALGLLAPQGYAGMASRYPAAGPPCELSAHPAPPARGAPRLGEHTDAVLAELGYGGDDIARLRAEGCI